jgi:site-specific recombinase XerD
LTVRHYQSIARRFLSDRFGQNGLELSRLNTADVASYVVRQSRTSSVHWAKYMVTALRSVLRYLFLRGELVSDLACAVPKVAGWRQASLPKALSPKEVQQLLQSCDRRTHLGRRDFAVLVLMVRLGLRAGEVAALEFDDFDWTRGEVVIRGKGREDRLPVPSDVGEAVVAYLRFARPQTTNCRKLFLSCNAPLRAISSYAVMKVVPRACIRAGLTPIGSHRLRHSAATQMLHQGASLSEIAQVLRHRSLDTTAIYAKVDRCALQQLAQLWPGGVR